MAAADPDLYVGRTMGNDGKYRVVRVVGVGGMGMVFEAIDTTTDRQVALKVMVDELSMSSDPRDVERFLTEAKAASAASHENVVQVLEVVPNHDPPFFAMELLDGENLRSYLSRNLTRPLDLPAVLRIAEGVLSGLAAAHRAGIVHRDIKPSNIFIEHKNGRVKILDFGIAKLPTGGPHTTTGTVMGTPGYLSKEQIQGERADARTDVHAVGLCLFELIAHRRPFKGPNDVVVAGLIGIVPPRVDTLVTGIPRELADIIAKSLAKDRADRFSDAGEMLLALRNLPPPPPPAAATFASDNATTRQTFAEAVEIKRPAAPNKTFVVSAGAVFALGAVAILLLVLFRHRTASTPTASTSTVMISATPSQAPTPTPVVIIEPVTSSVAPSPSPAPVPTPRASASASASAKKPSGPARPAKVLLENPVAWSEEAKAAAFASKSDVDACVALDPSAFAAGMQITFSWTETKAGVGWSGTGTIPITQPQRSCLQTIADRLGSTWTANQRLWREVHYNL
jgi:serine/threonine protein kinase